MLQSRCVGDWAECNGVLLVSPEGHTWSQSTKGRNAARANGRQARLVRMGVDAAAGVGVQGRSAVVVASQPSARTAVWGRDEPPAPGLRWWWRDVLLLISERRRSCRLRCAAADDTVQRGLHLVIRHGSALGAHAFQPDVADGHDLASRLLAQDDLVVVLRIRFVLDVLVTFLGLVVYKDVAAAGAAGRDGGRVVGPGRAVPLRCGSHRRSSRAAAFL